MKKRYKLIKTIILFSIFLLTTSKADLTNKIIMSVGSEMITDYDLAREIIYLMIL